MISLQVLISLSRWLAFAASLSLPLVYFRAGTRLVQDARRSIATTGSYTYVVFSVVMCLAAVVILAAQCLLCLGIVNAAAWAERWWLVALGVSLVVVGIGVAYWVRARYLGRFWSGTVELHEQHRVVQDGPYRLVRHPLYATTLMIYPGLGLAFALWWSWVACGIMIVGYIWLAAYEDEFLTQHLAGYREYRRRTPYKLVPGIW